MSILHLLRGIESFLQLQDSLWPYISPIRFVLANVLQVRRENYVWISWLFYFVRQSCLATFASIPCQWNWNSSTCLHLKRQLASKYHAMPEECGRLLLLRWVDFGVVASGVATREHDSLRWLMTDREPGLLCRWSKLSGNTRWLKRTENNNAHETSGHLAGQCPQPWNNASGHLQLRG